MGGDRAAQGCHPHSGPSGPRPASGTCTDGAPAASRTPRRALTASRRLRSPGPRAGEAVPSPGPARRGGREGAPLRAPRGDASRESAHRRAEGARRDAQRPRGRPPSAARPGRAPPRRHGSLPAFRRPRPGPARPAGAAQPSALTCGRRHLRRGGRPSRRGGGGGGPPSSGSALRSVREERAALPPLPRGAGGMRRRARRGGGERTERRGQRLREERGGDGPGRGGVRRERGTEAGCAPSSTEGTRRISKTSARCPTAGLWDAKVEQSSESRARVLPTLRFPRGGAADPERRGAAQRCAAAPLAALGHKHGLVSIR